MTMDEIIARLARLLVVRAMDYAQAQRPIDKKQAMARLEGAADATHRVVNAYGPEQVMSAVRETVPWDTVPIHGPGGRREWFEDRVSSLALRLTAIYNDEKGQ